MKAKFIILLVICAVATLSFTVTGSHKTSKAAASASTEETGALGGMVSEDPIK